MISVKIKGESESEAKVLDDSLLVTLLPYPPADVPNLLIPFTGKLTISGDGVTSDLRVDGSVNSIEAFIGPPVEGDLYLTTANILIADSGVVALNRFGGIAGGLANGIDIFIETREARFIINPDIKSNFDFIRIGILTHGIGGKNDAYQLSNTNAANEDGYNPILDFTRFSPIGIRLRRNTLDRLGITIKDDLTGLGTFNIVITGYLRI